jgi:putative transcriptional regulator
LAAIHETASGLAASGVLGKRTMKMFDELCLTPVAPLKLLTLVAHKGLQAVA